MADLPEFGMSKPQWCSWLVLLNLLMTIQNENAYSLRILDQVAWFAIKQQEFF